MEEASGTMVCIAIQPWSGVRYCVLSLLLRLLLN